MKGIMTDLRAFNVLYELNDDLDVHQIGILARSQVDANDRVRKMFGEQFHTIRHCVELLPFSLTELKSRYDEAIEIIKNVKAENKEWNLSLTTITKESIAQFIYENCQHKNIDRSDGCDECLDCGTRNY